MSPKSVGAAPLDRSDSGDSDITLSDGRQVGQHGQRQATTWLAMAHNWWWEIGAAFVSAVCMGLILVILTLADGIALEAWKLPIQPNSLISVFTTIGKSALMVPLAGCLSQLAWQHFASEPRSLDHIRVFDDASRGPWGAMELLAVIGKRGFLARLLAVATVLALGIEPFAQQILEFGNRDVEYPVQAVEIAAANTYQSRAFRNDEQWRDDPDKLSRVVIRDNDISNAILGVKTHPYFHCPPSANNCTYPAFTTLGVCGSVKDRAAGSQLRCEPGITNDVTCTFTWANNANISLTFNKLVDPKNPNGERQHEVFRLRVEPTTPSKALNGLTMTAVRANTTEVLESIKAGVPPKLELLTLSWYWCTQTYPWTNASSAQLVPSPPTTEALTATSPTNFTDEWLTFTSSSAHEYRIHRETHSSVWDYIGIKKLTAHVFMNTKPNSPTSPAQDTSYFLGTEQGTCHSMLEMFLYASNLHNVTQNIATFLSNYIRSRTATTPTDPYNPLAAAAAADNVLPGDNNNATIIAGSAWKDETYIAVRWIWISVPLGETILTILLLIATIVSARMSGVPVLGSAPLGLLFHGLERDAREAGTIQNRRAMVGVARGMEVQFGKREGDGGLGFRVVDDKERGRDLGGEEGYELGERGKAAKVDVRVEVIEDKGLGGYER